VLTGSFGLEKNPLVTKTKFGLDNLNFDVSIHNEDSEADHISSL
jgi:hypothetical protein